tara:strand:- start:102 stop:563 length:462 start_codon:yes stop_codon:yes gene_type:complete
MTNVRDLSSIENGLAEAIKILKTKVIKEITGKGESFIRKCSDPKAKQQLDHIDAVKIDKACIERGLVPYMLRSHAYIINKERKKFKSEYNDINELLIKFTILHGQLMDVIKSAKNPSGEKGGIISIAEKKEIYDAFHKLENKINKIKNTIEKG